MDYSIRGELVDSQNKVKNIYWSYHESEAEVKWIDNENVSINNRILNIETDTYDFRRE